MPRGIYDRSKSKPRPPHTEEAKRKIGIFNKGKVLSSDTKRRVSDNSYQKGKKGPQCQNWKGGIRKHSGGYVMIYQPNHPYTGKYPYILEHRLVMEKHLGRYLTRKEVVHHINEIRNDNRIENLMLFDSVTSHISHHRTLSKKNYNKLETKS